MSLVTDALVLKVSDVGESDRVITLLTSDYGVIRAFANRAKKFNSKMQSASQTLCYGEFNIYAGKDSYVVNDATAKEVFFDLRRDIEKVALAQYFCSLAVELIPEGEPAPESLRVILNSVAYLQSDKRSKDFLKAVTEFKLLSLSGFAPDVSVCGICGKNPAGNVRFDQYAGKFYCSTCSGKGQLITPGVLTAIRFITLNPVNRIYSFSLSPSDEKMLTRISEEYLLARLNKSFKALDFYKSMKSE